ncbi:ArsC family transcriptional regulator [Clostridium botulinum C]|uniref:ArsC family transcriptional regulator n=2 Tax=Clostridium botulinum TaxID=1491 RepID=A0A9Q4TJN3_CLOBO|nr:ArsC/Spx/MgsR family protein [Clostridium botulinum]MCD3194454.1 ArsC family transcriptional regulator [Clostridium botulinum C]MCD3199608.1 ArsC family transcriptional regulator [Clostridium botulinum C]MCD3205083.1 ArsC family transcriptional regulator [Clostridium botulinum C]MCD3207901.1 ArsC family transcriptional regulator [Clostridium botulinum C]MCD3225366.1 ArsC family transcriptional regulator [Clostridium botulinum C]
MNIQIFGIKKCFDTKKAERYFKERRIKYQFIDLNIKGLSKGEFQSVKKVVGLNNLINKNSREYKKLNMEYIRTESVKEEILLNNPKLYITPIVRNGKEATIGYQPHLWEKWI